MQGFGGWERRRERKRESAPRTDGLVVYERSEYLWAKNDWIEIVKRPKKGIIQYSLILVYSGGENIYIDCFFRMGLFYLNIIYIDYFFRMGLFYLKIGLKKSKTMISKQILNFLFDDD